MITRRDILKSGGYLGLPILASAGFSTAANAQGSLYRYVSDVPVPKHLAILFFWSDTLMLRIRDMAIKPPKAALVYGMGHLAGFVAVNAITNQYQQTYRVGRGPQGADLQAAYSAAFATAAEGAMGTNLSFELKEALSKIPHSDAKQLGAQWGKSVGKAILKWRHGDGSDDHSLETYYGQYKKQSGAMAWEPTLPYYENTVRPRHDGYSRALYPGLGHVKPMGVRSIEPFRAIEFPDVRSEEFARQLKKVAVLGAEQSPIRTKDQEEIAWFWEDGPVSVTPAGHFLVFALQIIAQRGLSFIDAARILALQTIAMADSGICAWDSKYYYDIARPETILRKRGKKLKSLNPKMMYSPGWRALIPTPPFPAYTSGHSCFGASGGHMLQLALGDEVNLWSGAPDAVNWPTKLAGVKRHYRSIETAIIENGDSREYGGVHWEIDNLQGLNSGRRIARHIFNTVFRPNV